MKMYSVFCVTMVLVISGGSSTYALAYKRPCRDLSPECLKNSLQSAVTYFSEGSPELGLDSLDPYKVENMNLTLPGVTIRFMDGQATGLKTCIVDFARTYDDNLEMQFHCDLTIQGRYRSSGRLLMFPIDGDGMSTINCDNLKLHYKLKLGSRFKNDKKYLEIKSYEVEHAYEGKVHYYMTNLFKKNPEMSKAVLKFMNSNWRMVAEEFGTPLVEIGVKAFIKNIRHFLDVMSVDELKKL